MSDLGQRLPLEQRLLELLPEAAVFIRDGVVLAANPAARRCLPQLKAGAPVPALLPAPGTESGGVFTAGSCAYRFRYAQAGGGMLLLFSPAPQTTLTDGQLDGVLHQMRSLLSELLAASEREDGACVFQKTFCRLFRLVDNLDFLRAAGQEGELPFRPASMDLSSLCRRLAEKAAPLLAEAGVVLDYQCTRSALLIPGDAELIQRLILELLSNAVRAAGGDRVVMRLRAVEQRAVLSLSSGSVSLTQQQLDAILQPGNAGGLPEPGAGAGLGLAIARHIAILHGGALLVDLNREVPVIALALPTGPLGPYVPVESPQIQRDGGLPPLLTALSDVLPARLFLSQGGR